MLTTEAQVMESDHRNQLLRKNAQIQTLEDRIDLLGQELDDLIDGADARDIRQQQNIVSQA